jgi:myo-inositol-1(or 4)-monophosphatase
VTDRELLDLAVELARSAGDLLLEHFHGAFSGVRAKTSPTDPVSDADTASQAHILKRIRELRPEDGILAEEGGNADSSSGITWVVDPLDGTVNFLFRIPVWSVSIAVEDADGAIVGVVHDPSRDETFSALRGDGASLNGAAISVSDRTDISTALVGTGFSYDARAREVQAAMLARVLPRVRDIRRAGSAALDLASLACGRLDAFYEAPMEPWDKAAGILLVREAGGVITELPPPLPGASPGVIGGNPTLHAALTELVT